MKLSHVWEIRRKQILCIDHKPYWQDNSSTKDEFWYAFEADDEAPYTLEIQKHSPHFMNFGGISWHGGVSQALFLLFWSPLSFVGFFVLV